MTKQAKHFKLSTRKGEPVRFTYATSFLLRSVATHRRTWVVLTRTGTFTDPRYGTFSITREMLNSMKANFDKDIVGQQIFIDVEHEPQNGVAATVLALEVRRGRLRAQLEWTPYGVEAVKNRGFKYMSVEFHQNYEDNEGGGPFGPTLLGAGLTTRPVVKRNPAVELSERYCLHLVDPDVGQNTEQTMDKFLTLLAEIGLPDAVVAKFKAMYKKLSADKDEDACTVLSEQLLEGARSVKTQIDELGNAGGEITLSIDVSGAEGSGSGSEGGSGLQLSEEQLQELVDSRLEAGMQAQATRLAEAKRKKDDNVALFRTTLSEGLNETTVNQLCENVGDLITGEMTEDQVKAFAAGQLKLGETLEANAKLLELGFGGAGARGIITAGGSENEIMSLSQAIRKNLRLTSAYANNQIKVTEAKKEHPFVSMVLAEFDRINVKQLHIESNILLAADGAVESTDTNLPKGLIREVIREALSDLRVLELIQTQVDPGAQVVTQIPYETRNVSQVINNGIVFEGQPIPFAGVIQDMEEARILPRKLAMKLSNEVIHFTRVSAINWEAWGRSVSSNARYMRELLVLNICNELQRAADAHMAVEVVAEALALPASQHKTANWPIVRQHQDRDLKGSAVGNPQNPITVTLNSVVTEEYDGSGNQAAGTYYRISNYNLGYVNFVDETGAAVSPPNVGVNTITYWHGDANVTKVDTDQGAADSQAERFNDILTAVGNRKAIMSGDRFVMPDYLLTSPVLHEYVTQAEAFIRERKRDGTDTTATGDLDSVKNIGAWSTNAPGIDLGDTRILMGVRNTLGYTIGVPYSVGAPIENLDPTTGRPTAEKVAYGEEYSAVHVPTVVRYKQTSVLAYSFSGR